MIYNTWATCPDTGQYVTRRINVVLLISSSFKKNFYHEEISNQRFIPKKKKNQFDHIKNAEGKLPVEWGGRREVIIVNSLLRQTRILLYLSLSS